MDSQLWPIILAFFFIFVYLIKNKFETISLWPLIIGPILFLSLIISGPVIDLLLIRAIAQYLGFSLILIASAYYIQKYGVPLKLIVIANFIYIIAAVTQLVFGSFILEGIVNTRTSIGRGVSSLAAEPTFFALILVFFSWIYFLSGGLRSRKINFLILTNVFFVIFVAKSSMGFMFVLILAFMIILINFNLKTLFIVLLSFVFGFMFFDFILQGDRISSFVYSFLNEGVFSFYYTDASANARLAAIVLPIHGFIENLFLPAGFSSYYDKSITYGAAFKGFFWHGYQTDKIMSFVAGFVYELGFMGLFYLISIIVIMLSAKERPKINVAVFFIFLFSAIPVGFSVLPFFISIYVYGKNTKNSYFS